MSESINTLLQAYFFDFSEYKLSINNVSTCFWAHVCLNFYILRIQQKNRVKNTHFRYIQKFNWCQIFLHRWHVSRWVFQSYIRKCGKVMVYVKLRGCNKSVKSLNALCLCKLCILTTTRYNDILKWNGQSYHSITIKLVPDIVWPCVSENKLLLKTNVYARSLISFEQGHRLGPGTHKNCNFFQQLL